MDMAKYKMIKDGRTAIGDVRMIKGSVAELAETDLVASLVRRGVLEKLVEAPSEKPTKKSKVSETINQIQE